MLRMVSLIISLVALATAAPLQAVRGSPTSSSQCISTSANACAAVSSLVQTASAANPYQYPQIPAKIAWDCLQSVPLNATAGIAWVQSLKPYVDWQSTTSYLKNPPAGYLGSAVNVYASIDQIISNLVTGVYCNEYEFEFDLYSLFQSTHDGHFRYLPTLVAGVVHFGRPVALVSYSSNGYDLPQPYVYSDVLLNVNDSSFEPSTVTQINGEDAITYLEAWSQFGVLQDPDALYNNVFYELAQTSLGTAGTGAGTFAGGGRGAIVYPNATTLLTFENGTNAMYENFGTVLLRFNGIQTGQDVYDRYLVNLPAPQNTTVPSTVNSKTAILATVTPNTLLSTVNPNTIAPSSSIVPAPNRLLSPTLKAPLGYPSPIALQINNLIGGYYLDDAGYEEIAVLSVPSFNPDDPSTSMEFQEVAFNFLNKSKIDGKTKLIIDLSANGGGVVLQGYSLFTNLFPDILPYGGSRFRAHETFNLLGEEISSICGPAYEAHNTNPYNMTNLEGLADTPFEFLIDTDINYRPFISWAEKYGPHEFNGDNFTSIMRYNLSDPITILESDGIYVNGYLDRANDPLERPFEAENIILLYDGYCASTCTIFSELMTSQGGVKTIAVGGRPTNTTMQAVGGVKGTNDWGFDYIQSLVGATLALGNSSQQAAWAQTTLVDYGSKQPFIRAADNTGYVNARDGIAQGDESQTPLQFVYQPADCRIFYTAEMTVDVTALWKTVADTAWGNSTCVVGTLDTGGDGAAYPKRGALVHKKHARRSLGAAEVDALHESMRLRTDLLALDRVIGDGQMLP